MKILMKTVIEWLLIKYTKIQCKTGGKPEDFLRFLTVFSLCKPCGKAVERPRITGGSVAENKVIRNGRHGHASNSKSGTYAANSGDPRNDHKI
jgi:hypothetical protein